MLVTLFICLTFYNEPTTRTMVITVDDLPLARTSHGDEAKTMALMEQVNRQMIDAFTKDKVPAIGFVNGNKLWQGESVDKRVAMLQMWLDAGLELGNHTYSHPKFQTTALADYQDDVIRGDVAIRELLARTNQTPRYFRHPYTSTGPTAEVKAAFEEFLAARGYQVAPFTVEHADYAFDNLYTKALDKGDTELANKIRGAYMDHLDTMLSFFEGVSKQVFDREIPQILLIHVNRLNGLCMADMLAKMKARGYRFISLEEALKDEAYKTPDEYVGPMGLSWLHRYSIHRGFPLKKGKFPTTFLNEPDPPKFIMELMQ